MTYRGNLSKKESNIEGLKWIPSIQEGDFRDSLPGTHKDKFIKSEFSEDDRKALLENFLKIKDECKCIVEIGIYRNLEESSSVVFLKNKNLDTFYIGIDKADKSDLNNPAVSIIFSSDPFQPMRL